MGISEIVKSKKMYGDNAPACEVMLGSASGEPENFTQARQGTVEYHGNTISRWVETASGAYMCTYINEDKHLVSAYCSDLSFLDTNYAIESETEQTEITLTGDKVGFGIDIVKLDNGKILCFFNDYLASTYSLTECYISNSGNGGDFEYFSTVNDSGLFESSYEPAGEVHVELADGVLFVSAQVMGDDSGTNATSHAAIFRSTDSGNNWTKVYDWDGSTVNRVRGISPVYKMPDGKFWAMLEGVFNTQGYLIKSVDGITWEWIGEFENFASEGHKTTLTFYSNEKVTPALAFCPYSSSDYYGVYKLENPTEARLADFTLWEQVFQLEDWGKNVFGRFFWVGGKLAVHYLDYNYTLICAFNISYAPIKPKSVSITQSIGQAGAATIELDNTNGQYSYDGDENLHLIGPNEDINVKMGYGSLLETVFTGLIDRTVARSFPQIYEIYARDFSKLALDGIIIRPADGFRTFSFVEETPEAIFETLAGWAGYTSINTDISGITIDLITFNWQTYGDAFGKLCDITGYDWWVDNAKAIYFRERATNVPRAEEEEHSLADDGAGTYVGQLDHYPIFDGSYIVTDTAGTTTYIEDTDYTLDLSTGEITALAGGALAAGGDILVSYTYPRHIFKEGEDILQIDYIIDDADLYYKVVAYGQNADGNGIKSEWTISSALFGVQENKLLKLDIDGTTTYEQLQNIADKVGLTMRRRARYVEVKAIAVPTVQIGDCVQIIESASTISEIYRITTLRYKAEDDGMIMEFKAYYVGYAPIGGASE